MDSGTIKQLIDLRESNPRWKNKGRTAARHGTLNPGPENTPYDQARHEKMRLRTVSYGNRFFVSGFREPKPICDGCDRLKSMCSCI